MSIKKAPVIWDEKELEVAKILKKLLKEGYVKIGVNVVPEYAEKGSGQWNVTKTYAVIGDERIELEEGNVEIIEGV